MSRLMAPHERNLAPYEDLLAEIMEYGHEKSDRTGTGTKSLFGKQIRYDLSQFFPLITTKKVFFRGVVEELLWLLSGSTNVQPLLDKNVHIWDEWADENGDLGPVYGKQWRRWESADGKTHDQISELVQSLKNNPDSRRHIVSAWNVGDVGSMALPPCHTLFQCYVADGKLSLQLYQRSCDMFLGVPFNIASYSLLALMLAQQTGYAPGEFIWTGGDCHIYSNHYEQVKTQLSRSPRPYPRLRINKADDIFSYNYEDFTLVGYDPHPTIKADVAV